MKAENKEITDTDRINYLEEHIFDFYPAGYNGCDANRWDAWFKSDIKDLREAIDEDMKKNHEY